MVLSAEFGFLSMGHEFDSYPKGRIRAPKDWNWFLEETKRSSDDEVSSSRREVDRKVRVGTRRKMEKAKMKTGLVRVRMKRSPWQEFLV